MNAIMQGYRTKGQIAYEHVRSLIVSGQLKPGDRLVIDQLASQLGVSKVPVREAVDRLVGEGWLDRSPHVGPFVPMVTPTEVRETAALRAAVESEAVRWSIPLLQQEAVDEAADLLTRMSGADDVAELNMKFHAALFSACPYERLRVLAEEQLSRASRFHTVVRLGDYPGPTQEDHLTLWDAVQRRDADAAASETRIHILKSAARLENLLTQQADISGGDS